jgi:hypothetical protein
MNPCTLSRQRRERRTSRRLSYNAACSWARTSSEFQDRPRVVLFGLGGKDWPPGLVAIHIQGGSVTDYIFERAAAEGRRYRAVAAFQHGKQISIPRELARGPKGVTS